MKEEYLCDRVMFHVKIMASYCGLLVPTHVMKKLQKLDAEYCIKMKQILNEYKSELLPYEWTLANTYKKNGEIDKQETICYSTPENSKEEVNRRISRFRPTPPSKKDVYLTDRKTAELIVKEILGEKEVEKI